MGDLSFSFLDLIVVGVVVVSTIFAVYRGFVRETLSIFAWAVAAFATIYFSPAAIPVTRGWVSPAWLADTLAYAGIFLVVLIPLSFVSYRFSEGVRHSPVGAVDRSLGLPFGVIRGLAVVAFAYILFCMIVPIPDHPAWVRSARLLPVIQSSSEVVLSLLPHDTGRHMARRGEPSRRNARNAHPNTAPKPNPERREAEGGSASKTVHKTYGAADRRALDNLIEATGNGGNSRP